MVELMVVVIIMAILGLAVMPSLVGSSEKAKYSRAWNDLNAIFNAFVALYGREGTIPDVASQDITDLASDVEGSVGKKLQSFLGSPIDKLVDPWGNPYKIIADWSESKGKGYIIVYVDASGGTAASPSPKLANQTIPCRADPYSNNAPMVKLVIDIPE